MRHPDIDYMMVMERRRDELAEAANARLIREAQAGQRLNVSVKTSLSISKLMLIISHGLTYLGTHMLNWSCRLQSRYTILAGRVAENQPSPCG